MIATDFTVENPERIKSLTWVAGGLRGFEVEDPRLTDLWAQMEALEEGRDWDPLVELETKLWVDGFGEPEDRVDPEVRRKMIQWNLENYLADQQANQPIQPKSPAAEHLDVLTMPTLFMWGTLDELGVLRSGEKSWQPKSKEPAVRSSRALPTWSTWSDRRSSTRSSATSWTRSTPRPRGDPRVTDPFRASKECAIGEGVHVD